MASSPNTTCAWHLMHARRTMRSRMGDGTAPAWISLLGYSSLGRQKSQVSTKPTAKAITTPAAAMTMWKMPWLGT